MNFFLALLGELVIVEICVLAIWLTVLFDAIKYRDATVAHKRLLMTSIGLVLNAVGVGGIIIFRAIEFAKGNWPFVPGLAALYAVVATGGLMFIIAASIGTTGRVLKAFIVSSILWAMFCLLMYYQFGSISYD